MNLGLRNGDNDTVIVEYEWHLYRFLFNDGRTLDVKAIMDSSDLREAVRKYAGADRIEGVALLPEKPTQVPMKKITKRVAKTPNP